MQTIAVNCSKITYAVLLHNKSDVLHKIPSMWVLLF